MDWSLYWTLYFQIFLTFPLVWIIFYTISSALFGPVIDRILAVVRAAQNAKSKEIL